MPFPFTSTVKIKLSIITEFFLLFYTYYAFFHDLYYILLDIILLFKYNLMMTPVETSRYFIIVILKAKGGFRFLTDITTKNLLYIL